MDGRPDGRPEVSGSSAGGDAAEGIFLVDDLVDSVVGPFGAVWGTGTTRR